MIFLKTIEAESTGNTAERLSRTNLAVKDGQIIQAERDCRELLSQDPANAEAWYTLGLLNHQASDTFLAVDYIKQAISLSSSEARYHSSLGSICYEQGQVTEAIGYYRQALVLNADDAQTHLRLAVILWEQNKFDEAVSHCKRSLATDSRQPVAHNYLAVALLKRGWPAEALPYLEEAVRLKSDYPEALKNLGVALGQLGQLDQALVSLQQAAVIKADSVEAHYNLGVTYEKLSRLDEAVASYRRVLQLQPDHAGTYNNLGIVSLKRQELETARKQFKQALRLNPKFAQPHYYLASHYQHQGNLQLAERHFNQAIALAPDQILWRLERDLLCPAIMPNRQAINRWRQQIEDALEEYPPGSIDLERWLPHLYGGSNVYPPFELAYHGRNDRPLREKLAGLFKPPAADLQPPCDTRAKMHLGFLVTRGHERGLILFWAGLIDHLSPEFQVTIIGPAESEASIRLSLNRTDVSYLGLLGNIGADVDRIRAAALDLLYYWEVGTDAENYLLPFFRLAPVQCTSWGNPATTGVSEIDYFVSSQLFESDQAGTHYTESLVELKTLGVYFRRSASQGRARSYFGFAEEDHIYLCTQNLKKFHPDFDFILGEILRQDQVGKLLLKAKNPHLNEALLSRFKKTIPDVAERIEWVPAQRYEDYLRLIATADVVLDTMHYSGGTTSFECLAMGTPIVTWPGEYMRGRMTYGCYQRIGVLDCVVWSAEAYIKKAVQLGTHRSYRQRIQAKLQAANDALYEDELAVRELEKFFRKAIKERQA